MEFEIKKKRSLQVISELESQCESYQNDIQDVDALCFLLRAENYALANKISDTENVLSEMRCNLDINKSYLERKSDQLIMQLASTRSEIEILRNVVNSTNICGSLNSVRLENEICSSDSQFEKASAKRNVTVAYDSAYALLAHNESTLSSNLPANFGNDATILAMKRFRSSDSAKRSRLGLGDK